MSGLLVAQLQPASAIVVAAMAVALLRGALGTGAAPVIGAWALFVVWIPFLQLTVLSLAVHALVRHTVLAHLVLITGWTLAVLLGRHGAGSAWYRFAEHAPLGTANGEIASGVLALRAGYWSIVSGALVRFTMSRWPRATAGACVVVDVATFPVAPYFSDTMR
jgi:hypothetical protein